jgi:hypothetical protein
MSGLDNTKYGSSALQGFYGWTDTLKGVYYGPGSVKTALPKLLNELGTKKALIVTGKSLAQKEGCFTLIHCALCPKRPFSIDGRCQGC